LSELPYFPFPEEAALYDTAKGKLQKTLRGFDSDRYSRPVDFCLSADMKVLALVGAADIKPGDKLDPDDGPPLSVCLWDLATGQLKQKVGRFFDYIHMALAPDAKTVVVSNRGQLIWLDVATGKATHTLPKSEGQPLFSPDGRILACRNRLYFDGPGKPPVIIPVRDARALAFSADSTRLVFSSLDTASFFLLDLARMRKGE